MFTFSVFFNHPQRGWKWWWSCTIIYYHIIEPYAIMIYHILSSNPFTRDLELWFWWFFYGLGSHGIHHPSNIIKPPFMKICLVHFFQASNNEIQAIDLYFSECSTRNPQERWFNIHLVWFFFVAFANWCLILITKFSKNNSILFRFGNSWGYRVPHSKKVKFLKPPKCWCWC